MKSFSKEYIKENDLDIKSSFSVASKFRKMRENSTLKIRCDGYNFDSIIDIDGECYVVVSGEKIEFDKLYRKGVSKGHSKLLLYIGAIFIVWLLFGGVILYFFNDNPDRGTLGDSFGIINTLFSGLALAGIIYTIFIQSKELKLQRKELALTREEMEQSRSVAKEQSETLKIQKFETTFFNLLENHLNLVDSFPDGRSDIVRKNQAIHALYEKVKRSMDGLKKCLEERSLKVYSSQYNSPFITKKDITKFVSMFENLDFILDYILKAGVKSERLYSNILYNSISPQERYLYGFYLEFMKNSLNEEMYAVFSNEFKSKTDSLIYGRMILPPDLHVEIVEANKLEANNIKIGEIIQFMQSVEVLISNPNKSPLLLEYFEVIHKDQSIEKVNINEFLESGSESKNKPFYNLKFGKVDFFLQGTDNGEEFIVKYYFKFGEIGFFYPLNCSVQLIKPIGHHIDKSICYQFRGY